MNTSKEEREEKRKNLTESYFGTGDVSSDRSKRLCESTHQNVNVVGIDSEEITNTSTTSSNCTNGMCLIHIQITLVHTNISVKIITNNHTTQVNKMIEERKKSREVYFVLFFDPHNFRKTTHFSLHGVDSFNDDEDFLPGTVCFGLAFNNRFTNNTFQIFHI
jgi:hypothetical protein